MGKVRFWVLEWGPSGPRTLESPHTVEVSIGCATQAAGEVLKVTCRSREKP